MKIKIILAFLFAFTIQVQAQKCAKYNFAVHTNSPGKFCNQTSTIYINSMEHSDPRDFVRLTLEELDRNGKWSFADAQTSKEANQYSAGPCYSIPSTFSVKPSYSGTNTYRVKIQVYRFNKITKKHELIAGHQSKSIKPWSYKATELLDLDVKNTNGNSVKWASPCLRGEFNLAVDYKQGANYNALYEFKVYKSNSIGTKIRTLYQSSGDFGMSLGDFSKPSGLDMNSWLNKIVYPIFDSAISSSTGGHLLFEMKIQNPECKTSSSKTTLLKLGAAPYINSFFFEWDHDKYATTPLVAVQISHDSSQPVTLGGISGRLVSDISTPYYDSYNLELHKPNANGTYDLIGTNSSNSIGGAHFQLNPNSVNLLSGFSNSDRPLYNPGLVYKVILTISKAGCPSATEWSYYTVDPNKTYYKGNLSNQASTVNTKAFHYVDRAEAKLNLEGFDDWKERNLKLSIISIDGRSVYSGNSTEYNLETTSKAVYLVFVTENDKIIYRSKFVW